MENKQIDKRMVEVGRSAPFVRTCGLNWLALIAILLKGSHTYAQQNNAGRFEFIAFVDAAADQCG